jgi:lysyl-tRNA synthetase class 2
MDIGVLKARARMLRDIRAFFYARDVLEVETPALSQAANTDSSIESFSVETSMGARYLHTSAEYAMKRLLVAGSGDIYQICKVWREGEQGSHHNPEFTMLEWYRVEYSYQQLMQEVDALLKSILPALRQETQFLTYREVFLEILGIDPHKTSHADLKSCIKQQSLNVEGKLSYSECLDVLMTHCIEPALQLNGLTFIYDYPAEQSALACLNEKNPLLAERFEVYLGKLELGNGYQELTDPQANSDILRKDAQKRRQNGQRTVPIDSRFLQAIQQGMPRSAGVAIGLDRLLMCRLRKKKIHEVISFHWDEA